MNLAALMSPRCACATMRAAVLTASDTPCAAVDAAASMPWATLFATLRTAWTTGAATCSTVCTTGATALSAMCTTLDATSPIALPMSPRSKPVAIAAPVTSARPTVISSW